MRLYLTWHGISHDWAGALNRFGVLAAAAMHCVLQDFSGYRKVVDLGGGYGHLLMDILDMYPSE
jgi:SAM-dependent MidA family methyltransferase